MVATFVPATVVRVMLVVMVQEAGLSALRTRRVAPLARFRSWAVGRKLMAAWSAKILLIPVRVFAIAIKVLIVVALGASKLVYFRHGNPSPFREVRGFVTKPLYHQG